MRLLQVRFQASDRSVEARDACQGKRGKRVGSVVKAEVGRVETTTRERKTCQGKR